MKKLLLIVFVATTLFSCNKADVLSTQEGEKISFGDTFVDNSTKAADKTYSGDKALEAFNVYGTVTGTAGTINIYNGNEVTGTVGANTWNCSVNQYWIAGATYNFAAVADATVASTDANGMPLTLTCNTAIDANDVQKDPLYATATATGKASGNDKVNFTFSHLLSKAHFTVKSNTTGGYYYSVKNIKVNHFVNGTYTINGATWAGTGAKADTEFGNIENVTSANTDGLTNEFQRLLIPTTADFTVSFTVELWNDNGAADDVKLTTENFTKTVTEDLVAGNAYDFNISLSVGELIQFTVTNNPTWTPATDGTNVTIQ